MTKKMKESPDKAAEVYDEAVRRAKESPEKAAAVFGSAKARMQSKLDADDVNAADEDVESDDDIETAAP